MIISFSEGCLWENDYDWEIHFDEEMNRSKQPCKHCVRLPDKIHPSGYKSIRWNCPKVVVAYNEGGENSTGICLDCILENVNKLSQKGE